MFSQFSYEEMLSLDDEKLTALGVTKGARHKIVISVTKLNERFVVVVVVASSPSSTAGFVSFFFWFVHLIKCG